MSVIGFIPGLLKVRLIAFCPKNASLIFTSVISVNGIRSTVLNGMYKYIPFMFSATFPMLLSFTCPH